MTWTLSLRLEIGRKAPEPPSAPEPDGISDVPQPITVYVDRPEPVVPPLGFEGKTR